MGDGTPSGDGHAIHRAMFEANSAVQLLIDPASGRIVDANQAAAGFYGWSRDELRAKRIQDINALAPDDVAREMEEARTRRRTFFRFRHRTASGETRAVEVHSGPFVLDGAELLFSIVHDVTDRDRLEEQLRRAQRLDTVRRLAGGVAHDFNNLLTVMMTCSGLIARHLPEGSPARSPLADLDFAIGRATELTGQLLAVGRGQVLREGSLDLAVVLADMEGLLRRTVDDSIEVQVEVGAVPRVLADRGQIEQVVLNLVLNAREAMRDGGRLTLTCSTRDVEEDDPRGLAPGPYAVLAVQDTGVGMDEATRAHVFDPFFTTRASAGGTGLGLSTAYGIVSQSQGSIDVISAPGCGATFEVWLPARDMVSSRPPPGPSAVSSTDGRRRVLLVEDQKDVREAIVQLLLLSGFEVSAFGSGASALEAADALLDDLVACVSDVRMPGMSGFELVKALRARRADLPVLFITGDLREHVREDAPRDVGFLQKPFRATELLGAVEDAIALLDPAG